MNSERLERDLERLDRDLDRVDRTLDRLDRMKIFEKTEQQP